MSQYVHSQKKIKHRVYLGLITAETLNCNISQAKMSDYMQYILI